MVLEAESVPTTTYKCELLVTLEFTYKENRLGIWATCTPVRLEPRRGLSDAEVPEGQSYSIFLRRCRKPRLHEIHCARESYAGVRQSLLRSVAVRNGLVITPGAPIPLWASPDKSVRKLFND